jgi:hypothetical protein
MGAPASQRDALDGLPRVRGDCCAPVASFAQDFREKTKLSGKVVVNKKNIHVRDVMLAR